MSETAQDYTPREAAAVCGIPYRTVLSAIAAGKLRAVHFNRRVIRVSRADLLRWRVECTASTAQLGTTPHKSSKLGTS